MPNRIYCKQCGTVYRAWNFPACPECNSENKEVLSTNSHGSFGKIFTVKEKQRKIVNKVLERDEKVNKKIDSDLAQFLGEEWSTNDDNYMKPNKESVKAFITEVPTDFISKEKKERFLELLEDLDDETIQKLYEEAITFSIL